MRPWTRKSAPIQPRTSLRKSDVSWPGVTRPGGVELRGAADSWVAAAHRVDVAGEVSKNQAAAAQRFQHHLDWILAKFCQNFVKISSNFSKIFINLCIQYSIFQHFSKSTHFCKILQKILQNFAKILRISENFAKFSENCQKFCKVLHFLAEICQICSREDGFLVDFEK